MLAGLIASEHATFAAGVPPVWSDLLAYADQTGCGLSSLRVGLCGGVSPPISLLRGLQERHGVRLAHAWGMTETRLGSATPPATAGEEDSTRRASAGRLAPRLEARLLDKGELLPHDGASTGILEVRAPWISTSYFAADTDPVVFEDGWLNTGDVAAIAPAGVLTIADRAKDVIKCGGEWVSSVAIKASPLSHRTSPMSLWSLAPTNAGLSARCHASCSSRRDPNVDALRAHVAAQVVRWWVPEQFAFVTELPRTSVGKVDKKRLHAHLGAGEPTLVASLETLLPPKSRIAKRLWADGLIHICTTRRNGHKLLRYRVRPGG